MGSKSADNFHWPLLLVTMAILGIGLVNLYSASFATSPQYFTAQLVWLGIALAVALPIYLVDYRIYERMAYIVFGITALLLVLVFFNRSIGGSQRWIDLGVFRLQPSELMKITLVLALAKHFHDRETPLKGFSLKQLGPAWALLFVPVVLVLLEPDLGTSLLLAAIGFTMMLFARIQTKTLLILFLAFLLSVPVAWSYVLKPYQQKRILTLLNPESDPQGSGYHRRQSIIAVGSGRLTGKGFKKGTQTQLRFLPEQHTDFIFSVWAEEQGFLGTISLLILYLALLLSGLHISGSAREKFGALAALGATTLIFWQVVINIGMVLGLLPVVGVTLPLMSYGGTSLVVTLSAVALLLNIYARRRLF